MATTKTNDKAPVKTATEIIFEKEILADSFEDGAEVLKLVEYVNTPYTSEIKLGQGVYVQVLGPHDTFDMRSTVPFTTEPAVKINEDGFNTTDTQYVLVTR
jgi:hypothetical protein